MCGLGGIEKKLQRMGLLDKDAGGDDACRLGDRKGTVQQ